jgi:catechol 2,3-dioxygenase-like lactoylglutathione lyase family enzyme
VIQHVTWEVRREAAEECAAFYERLGFRRVAPPPSLAERAVWLQSGPTQVHLMYVEEPATLPRGHVAVVVDPYEETLERLRAAGHDPAPRREHWGSPRSYVRDPAGNLVELMQFPPGD